MKIWNITKVADSINPIVKNNILFLHAWTGCDTSAIHGHGKTSLMKKIKLSNELQRIAEVISDPLDTSVLDPSLWGWKKVNDRFAPIKSDYPPSPERLLNFVRCNCNTTCTGNTCICRKNGLHCVSLCGDCHRENCLTLKRYLMISEMNFNIVMLPTISRTLNL